jgi:hypothetical protein
MVQGVEVAKLEAETGAARAEVAGLVRANGFGGEGGIAIFEHCGGYGITQGKAGAPVPRGIGGRSADSGSPESEGARQGRRTRQSALTHL